MTSKPHIAVIGAGAFGGWTALYLLRSGARVTLIDAWGPGNSRASSGGETRIIRGAYGPDQPYTRLSARAMALWREHESHWKQTFFFPIGVLWMAQGSGDFERGSLPLLKDAGIPFEQLSTNQMCTPLAADQLRSKSIWGIYEPGKADTCWPAHRRRQWSSISSPKAESIVRQRSQREMLHRSRT